MLRLLLVARPTRVPGALSITLASWRITFHSYSHLYGIVSISSLYHFSIESVSDPRQDLARRVKSARRARFMSQDELSERSGLGRATIARIELAQTTPHGRTIRSLAEALEVQPSDLVSDPDSLWGAR